MDLLLLHGAIGSSAQLQPLAGLLKERFSVSALDFSGHGKNAAGNDSFSIPNFAEDVLKWMDEKRLRFIDVFGYSMGGYVALYLAKHYPERVGRIFTFATKFRWSSEIAAQEIKMLDPDKISAKLPQFEEALKQRHASGDWKKVLKSTADMMVKMGAQPPLSGEDYSAIKHKVRLSLGDRDKMVGLDETLEVCKALPDASLLVVPDTGHPIEHVDTNTLAFHLKAFFT